uniref:G-protein coupled receptors family 1 profile domain-containing protein n=1 Tax=Monopterus albus TaxID=43700 RepID=A0A3Q3JVL2_MONAL
MELFNPALEKNTTFVHPAYFIISGFTGIPDIKYYYVFLFFVYIVSVLGNTTVMTVICLDHNLRTPKYIAVFNMAFVDLIGSSALVPKVLDIFFLDHFYIPYNDCLTFMFFCYTCLSMQSFNLVSLSYDRMIAIIFPLHYQVKVTHRFMFSLIIHVVARCGVDWFRRVPSSRRIQRLLTTVLLQTVHTPKSKVPLFILLN